jgi:hypothetical protein
MSNGDMERDEKRRILQSYLVEKYLTAPVKIKIAPQDHGMLQVF